MIPEPRYHMGRIVGTDIYVLRDRLDDNRVVARGTERDVRRRHLALASEHRIAEISRRDATITNHSSQA